MNCGDGTDAAVADNLDGPLTLMRARGGRWVRMRGARTYPAVAGRNRVVLRGRLARRALAAGRYRLVARAADAAGNRSAPRRAAFRVVAR